MTPLRNGLRLLARGLPLVLLFTVLVAPALTAQAHRAVREVRPGALTASTTLVINEIDYDQPGTDTAEFMEIKNISGVAINLSGWSLELVNGTGGGAALYQTINLPDVAVPAGGHYVVCGDSANTPNCDLDVEPSSNLIQNGAPDAVGLRNGTTLIDTVSYEGDTGAPYTETSGSGLVDDPGETFAGISRYPDGVDTDVNNVDLSYRCISPGQTNIASSANCPAPAQNTPTPIPTDQPEFLPDNFFTVITGATSCTGAGSVIDVKTTLINTGPGAALAVELTALFTPEIVGVPSSCTVTGGSGGSCDVSEHQMQWHGDVPGASGSPNNQVVIGYQVRVIAGTTFGTKLCVGPSLFFDQDVDGVLDTRLEHSECLSVDCEPTVDPNRQLGRQVHLPILNFEGQDDVCRSVIEVQAIGSDPVKAVLVVWGEPGFCPPQCSGPLKVECSGLLKPGTAWLFSGAQIPTGAKGGMLFQFSARKMSEVGIDLGFDDIVADLMCETLFFGVVGDCDDYRRFKKAYNEGGEFAGLPMAPAVGNGVLAVDVWRSCPGDVTPGSVVTSKYNGIAGTHLGAFDPVFGGFAFYAPLLYADKAGFGSVMYIQNGGLECSSVEIWFKAQDDCLRARICEIFTLAPGETYQFLSSDCVGPDWQGSAWLRSTQPLAIAVDIVGHDVLMTYVGEPGQLNYTHDPEGALVTEGNQVLFGPLLYSEYQGWDSGIQVQNLSSTTPAKAKVYFLDRGGDVVTTLIDWICPRGSQTYFLPLVHDLPGNWVGSVRVESQELWTPGDPLILSPHVVGVATLIKYGDQARGTVQEAIAYNLLPEHKAYDWQIGGAGRSLESGVGLIAIPSLLKDLDGIRLTSELAITNLVPKPGFTDFAIMVYDQNGMIDYLCEKLNEKQVEYIDLQTWGFVNPGFKGSAIISAVFWEHDVFDETGFYVGNLVGLGAATVERTATGLGEDVPGDEAAGSRGIPFRESDLDGIELTFDRLGPVGAICPGLPPPAQRDDCPEFVLVGCADCPRTVPSEDTTISRLEVRVPAACKVTDVDLQLEILNPFVSDLNVYLSHDSVIDSEMFTSICGSTDDVFAILDDDADLEIGSVCPPSGYERYTTESGTGLNNFDGLLARGEWVLRVDDTFGATDGTLNDWVLRLELSE